MTVKIQWNQSSLEAVRKPIHYFKKIKKQTNCLASSLVSPNMKRRKNFSSSKGLSNGGEGVLYCRCVPACLLPLEPKATWEVSELYHLTGHTDFQPGTQGICLKQKLQRNAAHRLMPPSLLSYFSHIDQARTLSTLEGDPSSSASNQ